MSTLVLLIALATAAEPASADAPAVVTDAAAAEAPTPEQIAAKARYDQLEAEMLKMAARNVWPGVEEAWLAMQGLDVEIPVPVRLLGADAARNRGDAWSSYQRLAVVLRVAPETEGVAGQMRVFRDQWGRVTVRRVEATPIDLVAPVAPLMPEGRSAVEFAAKQLAKTGGFDGMLPVGDYVVGPYQVSVKPGLDPVIVQRVVGDGR